MIKPVRSHLCDRLICSALHWIQLPQEDGEAGVFKHRLWVTGRNEERECRSSVWQHVIKCMSMCDLVPV